MPEPGGVVHTCNPNAQEEKAGCNTQETVGSGAGVDPENLQYHKGTVHEDGERVYQNELTLLL